MLNTLKEWNWSMRTQLLMAIDKSAKSDLVFAIERSDVNAHIVCASIYRQLLEVAYATWLHTELLEAFRSFIQ